MPVLKAYKKAKEKLASDHRIECSEPLNSYRRADAKVLKAVGEQMDRSSGKTPDAMKTSGAQIGGGISALPSETETPREGEEFEIHQAGGVEVPMAGWSTSPGLIRRILPTWNSTPRRAIEPRRGRPARRCSERRRPRW